jgi:hypothetical protein
MKARRVVKKAATRKGNRHYAERGHRHERAFAGGKGFARRKAFARKKARPSQGVLDLFVSTYETLG